MTAAKGKAAKLPVEHTCCVEGCKDPVWRQGLCALHREQMSAWAGPFARTAPDLPPQPPSRVKTGDPAPGAPPLRR
ncbi:MAG: hypothetical protein ACRDPQ_02725 [Nocardioidaceae bacterium]